jgi:alpha-tubulin suppressor-like RCC1 family protein
MIAVGNEHSICLGESKRVYVFGSNSHGQLGLGDKGFVTPIKNQNLAYKNISVSVPLHSIKEMSMDNSSLLRQTDETSALKEHIWELEEKMRLSESSKELLMSETLKFTSKVEKILFNSQRVIHSKAKICPENTEFENVG